MAGVNKAIIVGRLGLDPEIMYTQQGLAIVKLRVATSENWIDKSTNERQERTEWHRVTVFGKQAENCERFLSKGRQVYVEGRIQTSSYEKEGQTHYSTEIIANTVQFLGDKGDSGGGQGGGGYQQRQPAGGPGGDGGYQQPPTAPGNYPPNQGNPSPSPGAPPDDDDIPF